MRRPQTTTILLLTIAAGALALRLPHLGHRPMHTDEAVQAFKSGEVMTTGRYVYDPHEYHGPTNQLVTLPFMLLSAGTDYPATTEATYRIVPVLFGAGLILLLLLAADGLGKHALLASGAFLAISPAMVYYSRYYIHEMLLVFFSAGAIVAGWRYVRTKSLAWAAAAGAFAGLMHATKETCIVAYAAGALGIASVVAWRKFVERERTDIRGFVTRKPLLYAVGAGLVVSIVLFSSFFMHLRGPLDSVLTYATYITRGTGETMHVHPWYYYLKLLIYTKYGAAPLWTEGLIIALAILGTVAALTRRGIDQAHVPFVRFLAFYSFITVFLYSVIPYKTPWCLINFMFGFAVLAGVGAVALVRFMPNKGARIAATAAVSLLALQLLCQTHRTITRFSADRRNPYVYAHTSRDILRLERRADDLARVSPEGYDMLIRIVMPDAWPLPWYLRRFSRIGYWVSPPDDCDAPLIVADPGLAGEITARLKHEYQTEYYGVRPTVHLLVFIRRDLWDRFMSTRGGTATP